jgi:stage V sporulation protein G
MRITDVKISLQNEKKLKAFANIVIDDRFVIRGLKVIQGMHRIFIAMPSRTRSNGVSIDIAHPITQAFRREMEQIVLERYREEVERHSDGEAEPS